MGTPVLQLSNASNWIQLGSVQKTVTPGSEQGYYYPFEEITLPFLFDRHIFAILVTSSTAKPTWHYAGNLYVKAFLGLTAIGGLPEANLLDRQKLWLGEMQLFKIPELVPTYSIVVIPAKWLTEVNIYCWQYTGVEGDETENQLNDLQQAVNRIEGKLNDGIPP